VASKRMVSRRSAISKKIARISWQADALYHRTLAFLDDAGRMTADPEDYRAQVIPKGKHGKAVPKSQIERVIQELFEVGLIGLCDCPKGRCMEYTDFSKFNIIRSDRDPQVECKEPVGFQWMTGNDKACNDTPNLREVNLKEGKGREEPPPPAFQQLINKVREIRGWDFTTEQDVKFFEALLANHSEDLIFKAVEDLRVYQEKPVKKYTNLHATLRNWCANEEEWRKGRQDDAAPEKDLPLDDHGEPMVELAGGEIVSRKELGELIGFNSVVMTDKGWKLKKTEGESCSQ